MLSVPKTGRPRKTTPRTDNTIFRDSQKDPWKSCRRIKTDLQENYNINISAKTISRRLNEKGLFSRRPAKKKSFHI